jgi:SH3-like domain-containing protein
MPRYLAPLLLLLATSAAAQDSGRIRYAASRVNIRSGPATTFPVVATLAPGEAVRVAYCAGGWCAAFDDWRVNPALDQRRGYVSERVLTGDPVPARVSEPRSSGGSSRVRSSGPSSSRRSVSVQCSGTTRKGFRCRRMTRSANGRCWQHGGN